MGREEEVFEILLNSRQLNPSLCWKGEAAWPTLHSELDLGMPVSQPGIRGMHHWGPVGPHCGSLSLKHLKRYRLCFVT